MVYFSKLTYSCPSLCELGEIWESVTVSTCKTLLFQLNMYCERKFKREIIKSCVFSSFSVSLFPRLFPTFLICEMYVRHAVSMLLKEDFIMYIGIGPTTCLRSLTSRNVRQVLLSYYRIWTLEWESCINVMNAASIDPPHTELSRLLWYDMRPNCNAKVCTTSGMNGC